MFLHFCIQAVRLQQFKDFLTNFPERINAIQTIINGITASRLKLTADFEAEHLMTVIKPLFTGRLSLGETFLTRGLGLSKKAVKASVQSPFCINFVIKSSYFFLKKIIYCR